MTTQFLEKDFRCFNTDELFVLQNFHLRKKKKTELQARKDFEAMND